ncbi:MAG TPA: sigma-70 family RNA polymerase sigma factor [Polyangiaceae bacterium]
MIDDVCNPERLSQLARSGDPTAMDHITRCYADRLLAAAERHCRSSDADDAVQDALLIATEKLDTFRGDGSLEGWLVRLVASACDRRRRGRKNDPKLHDSEIVVPADGESPDVVADRHAVGALLERALFALDPNDRELLLLCEVEGMSAPEVADRVGLSPGAVRTRLSRLRARLREALGGELESSSLEP